MMSSLNYNLNW